MLIAHCAHIINHDSLTDELHQDAMHNALELIPEPDICIRHVLSHNDIYMIK